MSVGYQSDGLDRIELTIREMIESQYQSCLMGLEAALEGKRFSEYGQANIWIGASGIGKTEAHEAVVRRVNAENPDLLEAVAAKYGWTSPRYRSRTTIIAQYDGTAFAGIPWVVEADGRQVMIRAEPAHLPMANSLLWLLDEATKINDPDLMNILGQLLQERRLGEWKLSPACTISMTGNHMAERTGDRELHPHIYKRICIQYVTTTLQETLLHFSKERVNTDIIGWMSACPDFFMRVEKKQRKNANSRALHNCGVLLDSGRFAGRALTSKLLGEVGEQAGISLDAFVNMKVKLADPMRCLLHPDEVDIPSSREAMFALTAGIVARVERKTLKGFSRILERFEIKVDMLRTREDGAIKPSAEPVLAICSELAADPKRSWMIGDYLFDIEAGLAAGATTVLIVDDKPVPAYADKAHHIIRRLDDLLALLSAR